MENMLKEIRERVLADVKEADVSSKLEDIRVRVLGKKGELTAILRGMGKLSPEERPKVGQMVNEARTAIENAIAERSEKLARAEKEARLAAEAIDVTLPGKARSAGTMNPLNQAMNEMVNICVGMGYEVVEGPEVEYDH